MHNRNNPEEQNTKKRLVMIYLIISVIIQVLVLALYYFQEKQTALAFPMVLGIFITGAAIVALHKLPLN